MFVVFLTETRQFYIKKLFSYQFNKKLNKKLNKTLRVSENPSAKKVFMFVLFWKETRQFYIKNLFSYQFICSKSTL
jgi:hypothetical protein